MAIYRPPRSPWRARVLVAAAGFLIGGLIVWALLPEGEPSPAERTASVRSELIAAEGALEIVAIEYAESVRDGAIVAQAEYDGAKAALARSRARYEAVRADLLPEDSAEIESAYARLGRLMEQRVPNDELGAEIEELSRLLTQGVSP